MTAPDLKPCWHCGGEASPDGYVIYSKPCTETRWEDGSPITEAFFCNCPKCGVNNMTSGMGHRTRQRAIDHWNTRAAPEVPQSWDDVNGTQHVQFPRAPLAEALAVPTDDQVVSACLSYRHDFGLLDAKEREALMWQAREWLHAWRKEFAALRAIGERAE